LNFIFMVLFIFMTQIYAVFLILSHSF